MERESSIMFTALIATTILITGGAGFIGSNFIPYFCKTHPEYLVVNVDKLTYAGNLENLKECENLPNYRFVKGDICDAEFIYQLFDDFDIKGVINFAAETHVDNSITGPRPFIESNIVGTFNLLEAARLHWQDGPNRTKPGYENCRFHQISTDEVFGTLGNDGFFKETTPYAPSSPYSASKASADHIARAYYRTFGLNVTLSNCSNNYGPKQHVEKLIPKTIQKCLNEQAIPIYGTGKNVRDWLYVMDHCHAIDKIFHEGRSGESYNIGGNNERTNIEIVSTICHILDKKCPRLNGKSYCELITYVADRAGHDFRYAIDAEKIKNELGWSPEESLESGLQKTIDWYLDFWQVE